MDYKLIQFNETSVELKSGEKWRKINNSKERVIEIHLNVDSVESRNKFNALLN